MMSPLGNFNAAFQDWNESKKLQDESDIRCRHSWSVKRKCWMLTIFFFFSSCWCIHTFLIHSFGVCIAHLTLQCTGFGFSSLMFFFFFFILSVVSSLNIDWGMHGNKLHRGYCSMFGNCFLFSRGEHQNVETHCLWSVECTLYFLVCGRILARLIMRSQGGFSDVYICLHEK